MLSFLGRYHLRYHLMLSFFTVSKCYKKFYVIIFPFTFCVIIYVIIYSYHDIYIMKTILYNQKDNIKEFKNDNIYTIKMITSPTLKNTNILYTWKW